MPVCALPVNASDAEILRYLDSWVELLALRKFVEAMAVIPGADPLWDANLLAEVISGYCASADSRVTLTNNGTALDGLGNLHSANQRKEVNWEGQQGYVWYDLNIDGVVSDLTATFNIGRTATQLLVTLDDVHVM